MYSLQEKESYMKYRLHIVILLTVALLAATSAYADLLMIPNNVKTIGESAFENDCNLDTVELPDGLLRIEKRAFAYSGVKRIHLPASVNYIADDAFIGCEGKIKMTAEPGTYGYSWAKQRGLLYKDTSNICLVCLGYQLNSDGSMQKELIGRLEVLLRAAKKYPDALIVCSGGRTASDNHYVTEGGQMAAWLTNKGISASRILVEDNATTTQQNAFYTMRLLTRSHPEINQMMIITSDYDMETAVSCFREQASQTNSGITIKAGDAWHPL